MQPQPPPWESWLMFQVIFTTLRRAGSAFKGRSCLAIAAAVSAIGVHALFYNFADGEVARVRDQQLAELAQTLSTPRSLASRCWRARPSSLLRSRGALPRAPQFFAILPPAPVKVVTTM